MNLTDRFLWLLIMTLLAGCRGPSPSLRNSSNVREGGLNGNTPLSLPTAAFTSFAPTNTIPNELLKPPTQPFVIGPGDVLDIEILGEPNSQATVAVGPDGKVYYSLLPGTFVW